MKTMHKPTKTSAKIVLLLLALLFSSGNVGAFNLYRHGTPEFGDATPGLNCVPLTGGCAFVWATSGTYISGGVKWYFIVAHGEASPAIIDLGGASNVVVSSAGVSAADQCWWQPLGGGCGAAAYTDMIPYTGPRPACVVGTNTVEFIGSGTVTAVATNDC